MKTIITQLYVTALTFGCPLAVFAAAEEQAGTPVWRSFLPVFSVFACLILLLLFMPRFAMKNAMQGMQRYEEARAKDGHRTTES